MAVLIKVLTQYAFTEEFYGDDELISICRCCGGRAWLIEDINHKKNAMLPLLLKLQLF